MEVTAAAVYAEADADSLHVRTADEAYSLGAGNAAATYLNQDRLFAVMDANGIDAVHPGYGFLSENAAFAERCAARGIAFIGPTPAQMRAFGLKHTARRLAEENHVPLLPGTGLLDNVDAALRAAADIGYPVMLKSTAGGGGIGMQRCNDAQALAGAFESVKRLGENNFADGGVFLEKLVTQARHIEVQIFGDGRGGVIALGERDCSVQRRNQKVIEETPAPDLPAPVREQLHAAAVRLAEAVDYRSAGTVEFIYDADTRGFYFLEVNTRLQVEHGVTEQVYGIDLVAWMVLLGAGELPALSQMRAALRPRGHAIQARLYAEDPAQQFQPSAGLLTHVGFPAADGHDLRIDHWVEAGVEIPPFYDPMLAKVITWGDDARRGPRRLAQRADADRAVRHRDQSRLPAACARQRCHGPGRRDHGIFVHAAVHTGAHGGGQRRHPDHGAGLPRPHRLLGRGRAAVRSVGRLVVSPRQPPAGQPAGCRRCGDHPQRPDAALSLRRPHRAGRRAVRCAASTDSPSPCGGSLRCPRGRCCTSARSAAPVRGPMCW